MLTEAFVTKPAKSSVMPNARMIGHAVGAGNGSCLSRRQLILLEIEESSCASFSDR